jgi:hypothetical protein
LDSLRRDSAVSFGRNDEFDDGMGVRLGVGGLLSRSRC